jgi:tetratricopeptide (TPR) repeat protein
MKDAKHIRKDILKLEKKMQADDVKAITAIQLAEKYVEIDEPFQAIAVLLESTDVFPDDITLHLLCARFILTYQNQDAGIAESLVKNILRKHPDNQAAQRLLEQLHTCVETMHEVARPFGSDMSDLPTLKSAKVMHGSGKDDGASDERNRAGDQPVEELLADACASFRGRDFKLALEQFQKILEWDPDNVEAREGFRKTYKAIVRENETLARHRKVEVIGRTIRFLEAMRKIAGSRKRSERY